MKLKIGTINIDVTSFNESERKVDGVWETRLSVELDEDGGWNARELSQSIDEQIKDNDIIIEDGSKIDTFKGYELESIDRYVNNTSRRLSINFEYK